MNAVKVGIDLGGTKVLIIAGALEVRFKTGLILNLQIWKKSSNPF